MARDIYKKTHDRPFQYPEAIKLMEQIQDIYWRHTELSFTSDKQEVDNMPFHMKEGVLRNMLAISTIEVAVKSFWGQLGSHFGSLEWDMLGQVASESEVRHYLSYSHLLGLLGLEKRFSEVQEVPAIKGRFEYLNKYLKLSPNNSDPRKYVLKLILFSLLMEHAGLFGNFVPLMYYFKKWGYMNDIKNIVEWSALDESTHFQIGATIVNILRVEHPEFFDKELEDMVRKACLKSIRYEKNILDWVWEHGELEGLTKENILSFMKNQVNTSLEQMGFEPCFEDVGDLEPTDFFYMEVYGDKNTDFFKSRPTDYSVGDVSITADDLF